jgi:hypothetical protein
MSKQCPKCSYVRTEADFVPEYECPRCGVIYAKYQAKPKATQGTPKKTKPQKSKINWTRWRIGALLIILLVVAEIDFQSNILWQQPVVVAIHPLMADSSPKTEQFINTLNQNSFHEIEWFFERSAELYNFSLEQPLTFRLESSTATYPPELPDSPNIFSVVIWSLRMRLWAMNIDYYSEEKPDVQLVLLYHDPQKSNRVPHSFGLEKGKIGVAHIFASDNMAPSNKVVIAHELLHTLGASDKYDAATNIPQYPDGYANPDQEPLHPQSEAEIMGGRIPESAASATIPEALSQVVMGPVTATEIGWLP